MFPLIFFVIVTYLLLLLYFQLFLGPNWKDVIEIEDKPLGENKDQRFAIVYLCT